MKLFGTILIRLILVSVDACAGGASTGEGSGKWRWWSSSAYFKTKPKSSSTKNYDHYNDYYHNNNHHHYYSTTIGLWTWGSRIHGQQPRGELILKWFLLVPILSANFKNKYIMVCEVDGDYAPDQYQRQVFQ